VALKQGRLVAPASNRGYCALAVARRASAPGPASPSLRLRPAAVQASAQDQHLGTSRDGPGPASAGGDGASGGRGAVSHGVVLWRGSLAGSFRGEEGGRPLAPPRLDRVPDHRGPCGFPLAGPSSPPVEVSSRSVFPPRASARPSTGRERGWTARCRRRSLKRWGGRPEQWRRRALRSGRPSGR
jgi:hypothetical protein